MKITCELMACQDCLVYVSNGDLPEDRPLLEADIQNMGFNLNTLSIGDFDRDEEFSWKGCECCGSPLAGSRHHIIVLEE